MSKKTSARRWQLALAITTLTFGTANVSLAASATWNGTTDGTWATTTNWSATPVPGTGDTATFNSAGGAVDILSLGGITIKTILFDTASVDPYTFGTGAVDSQTLNLNDAGAITMNSGVTNNQLFNSRILLGTAIAGTYTITNNSTGTLTFAGAVQGGTGGTGAAKTFAVTGSGNTVFGTLAKGGASQLNVTKSGAGTLTLGGTADNNTTALTLSAGTVILNKASSATVHALGVNSTITAGTLQLSGSGGDQIVNSAGLTINGGTFDLNGKNETINNLTAAASGGTVSNSLTATTSTLTVGSNNASSTYAGLIENGVGTVAFAKIGTGTQTLSGVNTYSGGTTVSAGNLTVSAAGKLGADLAANTVNVAPGANLNLSAAANIGASQVLTINSDGVALGGLGAGFDGVPVFTNVKTTTGGVFGINMATFSTVLDLATLGGGGMFLGSQLGGTYTGSTLGVDGTIYRLGGGGGTMTLSNAVLTPAGNSLVVGDTRTNGTGTAVLVQDQTYNGATTINTGSSLQLGNGGTTGSILSTSSITANGALAINRSDSFTFGQVVSGTGGITKMGSGTLTLGATQTYTGTTTILGGTLLLGGTNIVDVASKINIGNNTTSTGTLDLGSNNQTVSLLTVSSNSATANTINIPSGQTLTVNGNFIVGNTTATGSSAQTVLNFTGTGALNVTSTGGSVLIGQNIGTTNNSALATVNMATLTNFTANLGATGTFTIQPNGDNRGGTAVSSLRLSDTANTITTNLLAIGGSSTGASGNAQTLFLGAGTNVLNTNVLNLGTGSRDSGLLQFAGVNGSVVLRNAAGTGRVTTVTLGPTANQTTATTTNSKIITTGHNADLAIGTFQTAQATKSANSNYELLFDQGTLDIKTVNMATAIGTAALANTTSTITIGGGIVRLGGSTAYLDSGTGAVTLATAATGTLNITGGSVFSTVDINKGSGTGAAILTLNGGLLDLGNNKIGGSAAANNLTTLNFQSGTLQNVADINNGAAISKTTAGMLILDGNNTYAGATNVNAGTLRVNGKIASAVNVIAGTLDGTGDGTTTGLIGAAVLIGDGTGVADSILAPGNSIGTLTATGALTFNTDGAFNVEIDTTSGSADKMVANGVTIGAGVNINFAELNPGILGAGSFTLIDNTSASLFSAPFANLAEGGTVILGANSFTATYLGGTGNDLVLNVVPIPEPSTMVLGGIALLGLAAYRRRRQSVQPV